jgi:hypothetical protein
VAQKGAFLFIFANFLHFLPGFFQFCALFCSFLGIFDHFSLAYITQTPQLDMSIPVFNPKTNVPLKTITQKTPFFPKLR